MPRLVCANSRVRSRMSGQATLLPTAPPAPSRALLLLSALHWLHMQSSALAASLPVASPWAAAPFLSVGGGVCGGAGASPLVLQAR